MLGKVGPRLRRADVMLDSFGSCIPNASEEFTRAPEMSFSKIFSQPRVLLHKFERRIPFKQLQSFTNTHSCWQFNKQMDMVDSNVQFVNFAPMSNSNLCNKPLAIDFDPIKFKWVPSILGFPHEVECILPEGVFKTYQFHFVAPKVKASKKAHANFVNLFQEPSTPALHINKFQELNVNGGGLSSHA